MFGRKKKQEPAESPPVLEQFEGFIKSEIRKEMNARFTHEGERRPITLKQSGGENVREPISRYDDYVESVLVGNWYATVDDYRILGPNPKEGVLGIIYEGFGTAAQAEKAAKEYINNRPIVRLK